MDNFIVSALKYRPKNFSSIIGQKSVVQTLQNSIKSNQLAQAFLFCGPRGTGKTTSARVLARAINCKKISENAEPCNDCESCNNYNHNQSFNIHELDAASNNSVDDIRSLVEQIRFVPQEGKYSIYIIDEIHMLSKSAFNAFLKTLEEPPKHAVFILATTEKNKIIPTILSRCQIYDFKRITIEDIVQQLKYIAKKEHVKVEDEALHQIAKKSDGALRDALSIFDRINSFSENVITLKAVQENLNILDYDFFFEAVDNFISEDIKKSLILYDEILFKGFDSSAFMDGLALHLRNLLVSKDQETIKLLEQSASIQAKYLNQSNQCEVDFLLSALELCSECSLKLKQVNSSRLLIELTLMQLSSLKKKKNKYKIAPPDKKKENLNKIKEEKKEERKKSTESNLVQNSRLTISVNDFLNSKEDNSIQLEGSLAEGISSEKFSLDQLNKIWISYANILKKERGRMSLSNTMLKEKPQIKEKHKLFFKVKNKIQKSELENEKMELLNYLRQKLNNFKIVLEVFVQKTKEEDLIYTGKEKFNYLVNINPELKKMRDEFDLEVDL